MVGVYEMKHLRLTLENIGSTQGSGGYEKYKTRFENSPNLVADPKIVITCELAEDAKRHALLRNRMTTIESMLKNSGNLAHLYAD